MIGLQTSQNIEEGSMDNGASPLEMLSVIK